MNAYESGERRNIPAVLVYVLNGDRVLMLHRDRAGDFHGGKWNGLGGKCELDEAYAATAVREVREESGIALTESQLRFAGFLQFPNFKPRKAEDWSVMVFTAEVTPEQAEALIARSEEGQLHWIARPEVPKLNLWPGDHAFLPLVLAGKPFFGAIGYDSEGRVVRSEICEISASERREPSSGT